MKNKILTMIMMLFLTLTSLHAQNGTIATEWEASSKNKWQQHPDYERYVQLEKESKTEESLQLKRKIVKEISDKILINYIDDYDDRYKTKIQNSLSNYPEGLRILLADFYDKGKKLLINQTKKVLNHFTYKLYVYAEAIDKGKMNAEQEALELEKKFPEFKNTEYITILISTGKGFDTMVNEQKKQNEEQKKQNEWDKIIEKLKRL